MNTNIKSCPRQYLALFAAAAPSPNGVNLFKRLYHSAPSSNSAVYMIDIESTGVDKVNDDVLSVAVLELNLMSTGQYQILRGIEIKLHSKKTPQDFFAKKYMAPLYEECNNLDEGFNNEWAAKQIQGFIGNPEDKEDLPTPKTFVGLSASNFDLEFLQNKGILRRQKYVEENGKQKAVGDVCHRVFEMQGLIKGIAAAKWLDDKTVKVMASDIGARGMKLSEGLSHDALDDCFHQVEMLNGLLYMAANKV